MTRTISSNQLTLLLFIVGVYAVAAQDTGITRTEFLNYMERSDKATRTSPYRRTITVETSDVSGRGWQPYSSIVIESIMPDRSHTIYKTRLQGEHIRVGKTRYSKEADGSWVRNARQAEGWIVTPASTPVLRGPVVEYTLLNSDRTNESISTAIRVVSKPEDGSENITSETLTYTYWFDEKGLLYKHESIAFNGRNWVRTTEAYEYDPSIKIEAPIK